MEYFDFGINLAFVLMILSTLASVAYGLINWNKDGYVKPPEYVKDWNKTEKEIEDEL
ncbi:MAG: hypothetical protein ACJAWW_000949 [Sulfurimonas sp.]|jgi:hypothetical protein